LSNNAREGNGHERIAAILLSAERQVS